MKNLYLFLITSIILCTSAFYLALNGVSGWGRFLFGGIITFVYPVNKNSDDEVES